MGDREEIRRKQCTTKSYTLTLTHNPTITQTLTLTQNGLVGTPRIWLWLWLWLWLCLCPGSASASASALALPLPLTSSQDNAWPIMLAAHLPTNADRRRDSSRRSSSLVGTNIYVAAHLTTPPADLPTRLDETVYAYHDPSD